jgi:hypothetical protein
MATATMNRISPESLPRLVDESSAAIPDRTASTRSAGLLFVTSIEAEFVNPTTG